MDSRKGILVDSPDFSGRSLGTGSLRRQCGGGKERRGGLVWTNLDLNFIGFTLEKEGLGEVEEAMGSGRSS